MTLQTFSTIVFCAISTLSAAQDITVKGTVYDKDSITPMQFAYTVNKNTSTGLVADEKGSFVLRARLGDTIAFSYVGYHVTKIFTHQLKDSVRNSVLYVKAYLKPKIKELNPVIVTPHAFSKEQKESYKRKIDEYHRTLSSPFTNGSTGAGLSIDALYYAFSKKGKQLQKLSLLYDQLLIDEIKEARLNPERVRALTGNDTLDVKEFLNYCFLPDQFIVSASDYDLFLSVNKYYRQYMEDKRRKK